MIDLNAPENFRLTVLSGLSPEIIMDIATRSIAFYQYQVTQEFLFSKNAFKEIQDKSHGLEKQLQNVLQSAQEEIESLQSKYQELFQELENEKRVCMETQDQLQDKCRQFKKLQTMYDKLKRSKSLLTPPNMESREEYMEYMENESHVNQNQALSLHKRRIEPILHSSHEHSQVYSLPNSQERPPFRLNSSLSKKSNSFFIQHR